MRARTRIRLGLPLAAASLIAASASVHAGPESRKPAPAPTGTQGQSQAVLARLVPYVGLPGVTTSVGLVTSQVASGEAQASAAAADFGLLGTLAAGAASGHLPAGAPSVELPSPISADSEGIPTVDRDPFAAAAGQAQPAAEQPGDPQAFAGHESASASRDPLAATGTVLGPTLKLPGVFELSGGRSTATSAETGSKSEVTLGRLALGNGAVVLSGLRWAADQVTANAATSGFSLQGMTVNGQTMPVGSPAELASSLAQANEQLGPLGLVIEAPTNVADAAGASVAPLVVQVRNPEALVDPTNQASAALAPVVTQLMDALIKADPDAAAAQIVANALVGGAGGRSGGRLEIGGVTTRSALVTLDSGAGVDAVTNALTGGAAGSVADSAAAPSVSRAAVGGLPPAPVSDVRSDQTLVPAQSPATQNAALGAGDHKDNSMAVLALAFGLVAVIVLALGDRLRMAAGAK